jgi:P pilus assembly/Cpx signaling pathway, periplasmic inhibitor/zinc-resistance associated protein
MKKKIVAAVLVLATAAGAGLAIAGGPGFGRHGRGRGLAGPRSAMARLAAVLCRLDLSQQQQDQVRAIIQAARPEILRHVQALREGRQQLRAMAPGTFDEKTVRSLAAGQAAQLADLIVLREKVRSQIYDVLTPAQQKELASMQEQRRRRMQCLRGLLGAAGGPGAGPAE